MGLVAYDIATLIAEAELSWSAVGTDVFIGNLPDTPDDCCKVSPTTGRPPTLTTEMEIPGIQVIIRDTVFADAYKGANNLYKYMHQKCLPEITGTTRNIYFIEVTGAPIYLGQDQKQRHLFSINALIYTETAYEV
jgi:hypothetical protein